MAERIRGLDISHWQGAVNFSKAKENGAQFVIFKASQNTWTDTRFVENYERAGEAGLLRGAYHFSDYSKPAKPQAEYFYSLLQKYPIELYPALDYEFYDPWGTPSNYGNASWILNFLDAWKGKQLTLYCNASFVKNHLNRPVSQQILDMPLWVAWYPNAWARLNNRQPIVDPWKKWAFWQHTDRADGLAYGMESKQVDENIFDGSLEDLKSWINLDETSEEPEIPDVPDQPDCPPCDCQCKDIDWETLKAKTTELQTELANFSNLLGTLLGEQK